MSPMNKVGVLAFATAVAAVPHAGAGHQHAHLHKRAYGSSSDGASAYAASSSYLAAGYGSSYHGTGTGYGYARPTGYSSSSSGPCSYTSTCIWRSKTSVSTVYGYPTASSSSSYAAYSVDPSSVPAWVYSYASEGSYSAASATAAASCAADVTITQPVYVTVTATYTASASYAAAGWSSSSSPTDPASTSSGAWSSSDAATSTYSSGTAAWSGAWSSSTSDPAYTTDAAGYSGSWGSSTTDPVYTTDAAGYSGSWGSSTYDPVYTTDTTCTDDPTSVWSSSAAAYQTSSSADPYGYGATSSSDPAGYSATSTYTAAGSSYPKARAAEAEPRRHHKKKPAATAPTSYSASGFSSKRGLAYNDVSLTNVFTTSGKMGWGYNWVSNSGGLSGVPYIPELHDGTSTFTASWASDAQSAIDNGAQYLFSFNEPDMPTQANMAPAAAASAWMTYMEPFAGKAKLVAPAVSNSGAAGQGIDWLTQFMAACSSCTIDAVNAHWYDSTSNDMGLFQSQIGAMASKFGKPVFVGEFGFIGSDSEISSAMTQAMSYMDSNDAVVGYAYFMVADGNLVDGTSASSCGETYMS